MQGKRANQSPVIQGVGRRAYTMQSLLVICPGASTLPLSTMDEALLGAYDDKRKSPGFPYPTVANLQLGSGSADRGQPWQAAYA